MARLNPRARCAGRGLQVALRAAGKIRAKRPLLLQTLEDCLKAKSGKVRIEALKLAFLYGFGKSPEFAPELEEVEEFSRLDANGFTEAEMEERAKLLAKNEAEE